MDNKTYTTKANANRAAKKALESAPEGTTFTVTEISTGVFCFNLAELPVVDEIIEQSAHNPAETMKAEDTISSPVEIAASKPIVEDAEDDSKPARPYSYLPEDDNGVVNTIREMVKNNEDGFLNFLSDAGVLRKELSVMEEATALAHLLKIVKDDRAGWDHDFGGKRATPATTQTANDSKSHKSEIESPCKVVWDTAVSMPGARRKDVLAACEAKGVAYYTARTQYQTWLTATKASSPK